LFGCQGESTTYGQIITVPKGKTQLDRFSFWWQTYYGIGGTVVVRGEVYKWDGEKATGPSLYESGGRRITPNDYVFHEMRFVPMIAVSPGEYVLFVTADKDFRKCQDAGLDWGALSFLDYPKGTFVYQENDGDSERWTTVPWGNTDINLAFKASLRP
jgi:hypothetical protein